ncbi:MAG: DUF4410 domain-containing protein [bacterium]|nr:DUF4410 domain-containing protein [bacterium]
MRTLPLLALVVLVAACAARGGGGNYMTGQATVTTEPVGRDADVPAPRAIYVGSFVTDPAAIEAPGGVIGEGEQLLSDRPRLLGGEGPLQRRAAADQPTPEGVSDTLEAAITSGLDEANLGIPVYRLAPGAPPPEHGWLVTGDVVSVDPGNRAERAAVGFGAGAATAKVDVSVDAIDGPRRIPAIRMSTAADSGHMPGGAVTMNPYVIAAKFVLGRNATAKDLQRLGGAIAQEIATRARASGG